MFATREADVRPTKKQALLCANAVVVVPAHNERANLEFLLPRLRKLGLSVLVVEDASSDGSAELLDSFATADARIAAHHRPALLGLGTAYVEGFARAIAEGFDVLLQMDADLSHDPDEVPRLLDALSTADLVLGSRYLKGGSTPGWSGRRRLLSRFGGVYTRLWTRLPIADPTTGFRAFRASALRSIDLSSVRSRGFAFQVEVLARAHAAGLRIAEVPITFRERVHGCSKLSRRIVLEALAGIPRLRHLGAGRVTQPRLAEALASSDALARPVRA